jgi:hypothetical protein
MEFEGRETSLASLAVLPQTAGGTSAPQCSWIAMVWRHDIRAAKIMNVGAMNAAAVVAAI